MLNTPTGATEGKPDELPQHGVAMTGLQNAGKTTAVIRFSSGNFIETAPTRWIDIEVIERSNVLFSIFDLGGHPIFRQQFWAQYIQISKGVIFVLDVTAKDSFKEAHDWLKFVIENLPSKTTPILILANKIDLDPTITSNEIVKALFFTELQAKTEAPMKIFLCSAKEGTGMESALIWLTRKITKGIVPRIDPQALFLFKNNNLKIEYFNNKIENIGRFRDMAKMASSSGDDFKVITLPNYTLNTEKLIKNSEITVSVLLKISESKNFDFRGLFEQIDQNLNKIPLNEKEIIKINLETLIPSDE